MKNIELVNQQHTRMRSWLNPHLYDYGATMRIPSIFSVLFTIACSAEMKTASDADGLIGETDRPVWNPDPQTIDNGSSSSTISWSIGTIINKS